MFILLTCIIRHAISIFVIQKYLWIDIYRGHIEPKVSLVWKAALVDANVLK